MSSATAEAGDYCVGRDEELGRLAILSDVSADRPVIVTGPWGSGKSTLLRALAARARASGVHVIHASPARPLARGQGAAPASLAPYADLRALLGQLAPLTRRPGPAEAAARRSPLATGVAAVRLLASAAEASAAGVLALVDDDAGDDDSALLFSLAAGNPGGDQRAPAAGLRKRVSAAARSADRVAAAGADPRLTGMAAWLLDESELAVGALGRSLDGLAGWTGRGLSGEVTVALARACLDTGRWSRAGELARRVLATEMVDEAESSIVAAQTILAFLAAHRGDTAAAARLAAAARDQAQSWSDRAALARYRLRAAGRAAQRPRSGTAALSLLLLRGGRLRAGRRQRRPPDERQPRAGQRAAPTRGCPLPRAGLPIAHARGLLSAGDHAERHFRVALGPGSGQWPVEQARTTLH